MAIVAQIQGGLGNQLFQYAMARAFAYKNKTVLKLDSVSGYRNDLFNRKFLLNKFNVQAELANSLESYSFAGGKFVLKSLLGINSLLPRRNRWVIKEDGSFYDPCININGNTNIYLRGYWQSYRYFECYRQLLETDLTLKTPLDKVNKDMEFEILNSESVSIHVRQDNLSHKLDENYYLKALDSIKLKVKNPRYFVFSDSTGFSRDLATRIAGKLVDINSPDDCCKDLWLMSCCRHHIVANSTFSWWGAWLADTKHNKQVFVPSSITRFNVDIIPSGWTVLQA